MAKLVLIADDEDVVRRLARHILELAGYEVLCARDGLEAIHHFDRLQGQVDALLLDLSMPGLNGEEVLERVRQTRPDVPVILSSGYDLADSAERWAGPAFATLAKPYTPKCLIDTTRALVEPRTG